MDQSTAARSLQQVRGSETRRRGNISNNSGYRHKRATCGTNTTTRDGMIIDDRGRAYVFTLAPLAAALAALAFAATLATTNALAGFPPLGRGNKILLSPVVGAMDAVPCLVHLRRVNGSHPTDGLVIHLFLFTSSPLIAKCVLMRTPLFANARSGFIEPAHSLRC